tara:strand:- start:3194 stop:4039 length:846 start_codon:yes stop_codon:yes gene_type:complete
MDRSQGRKKSDFVAKTSVDAGAYIDYFVNGTNYKILYTNFLSGLGVTGTIVSEGDASGIAVLNVDGTVNKIRNIENGSGIIASVSANGGVKLQQNFTADTTGEPILRNITDDTPDIVSLVAGDGITIARTDNYLTISETANVSLNGLLSIQGNSTATTIAGAGTSVLVAGTWVVQKSNIGSSTTGGRITYTGSTTQEVRIDASLSVKAASASGQNASLYVAKNGTVITASRVNTEVDATVEKNINVAWIETAVQNDYFELFVANESGTDDLVVTNGSFRTS